MTVDSHQATDYRHAAFLYSGDDDYLSGTVPFVRAGLDEGSPVLVMVPGRRLDLIRGELGADASEVLFADMEELGSNPARIIPAWREFVLERVADGGRVRGIGEPIWYGRSPEELVECQRHEALLNLAFGEETPMDLLCPYDESALDSHVIEEALRSHPILLDDDGSYVESDRYAGPDAAAASFRDPLPPAPVSAAQLRFDGASLDEVRAFTTQHGSEGGLGRHRVDDLVLAVNELASNSVRHGGGGGLLRIWSEPDAVVAEVSDGGHIEIPLAGRELPDPGRVGGNGLWLVNQVSDLLQLRTYSTGSVVRVHVRKK